MKQLKKIVPHIICIVLTVTSLFASGDAYMRSVKVTDSAVNLNKEDVMRCMKKVADWQLDHPTGKPLNNWEYGPFYQGLMKLYFTGKDKKYMNATVAMGNTVNWEPLARPYDANSIAIIPAFADLYSITKDVKMIDKSRFLMDMPVGRKLFTMEKYNQIFEPEVNLANNKYWYEWWTWCDALFMAPPAFAQMSVLLHKPGYMSFMVKNYWLTADYLYSKQDSLFFRDDSFFEKRSANGTKIFWSRGNGWVIGGLCGVMNSIPKEDIRRKKFEQLFVQMCEKLAKTQMDNGCWSPSLIDARAYPQKEVSGTAFFCYGFAWGVNNGLLSKEKYLPIIQKAWQALTSSIHPDGKLGYVQRVGDKPDNVKYEDSESYGSGAFLLAGCELYKLLNN